VVVEDSTAVEEEGGKIMTGRFYFTCAALVLVCAAPSIAQERFESPEEAAKAVIHAASNHDPAQILSVLGPNAKQILSSGNPEQDRAEQDEFAREASEKHRIQICPVDQNRAILSIGDEDWPFPVPIVRTNGKWSFDASDAPVEMRARKVGANELDAIEICRGYVDAQRSYASEDRDKDGMLKYAPHLMSSSSRHDGLYWAGATAPMVPESFAQAEWDGTVKGRAKPYHGYYFRVLERQGSSAPGGAHNYMVKDKLIGGFGLVAWPAEYGVTGIHTFIVNQNGVVYEKDVAPIPGKPAAVTSYDPDHSWEPVD
jgi:hypothetical protein